MSVDEETVVSSPRSVGLVGRRIPWARILGVVVIFLLLAAQMFWFYRQNYVGLTDRAVMDVAQVGRNIAEGRGFTTRWIRPLNLSVEREDIAQGIPELNNGPVYPYVSALFFKLRTPCDQVTIWGSLLFMFLTVLAAFGLGVMLFDLRAGLLAASVLALSARVIQVGTSGTMWPMVACMFMLLLMVIAVHHKSLEGQGAGESANRRVGVLCAAAAAVLLGLLYMTDYVLIALLIPLAVYFWTSRARSKVPVIVFVAVTALMVAPCAYRNAVHTGFPVLGISAWDIATNTPAFPSDTLVRSTYEANRSPVMPLLFPLERFPSFAQKLVSGSAEFVESMIPMLGMLVLAFAVVSMLYRFKNRSANAVRGFVYGAAPLLIVILALYGRSTDSLVVLAPVVAVFGSAYFILLVEAKKLHQVYARGLVGLFVLATAFQAISGGFWPTTPEQVLGRNLAAHQYLNGVGNFGVRALIYTDVPWMIAWRTSGAGVWLPRSDADVFALSAKDLPMRYVILTPESESYSTNEIWYLLQRVRIWREYVKDPRAAVDQLVATLKLQKETAGLAGKYLRILKRDFAVSDTIAGFVPRTTPNPLAPDDIQVLISPEIAPR